jgi:hypothetical protein
MRAPSSTDLLVILGALAAVIAIALGAIAPHLN